jgi:hypothetical protein
MRERIATHPGDSMCKQRLPAPRWPVQEHAARGRDARVHVHLWVLQRERDELEQARDRAARAADVCEPRSRRRVVLVLARPDLRALRGCVVGARACLALAGRGRDVGRRRRGICLKRLCRQCYSGRRHRDVLHLCRRHGHGRAVQVQLRPAVRHPHRRHRLVEHIRGLPVGLLAARFMRG